MDAAEYAEQQEEELEALTFIYTDEMEVVSDKPPMHLVFTIDVPEQGKRGRQHCGLDVVLPATYPSVAPELKMVKSDHVAPETQASILAALAEQAEEQLECPMIFTLVDYLRENMQDLGVPMELTAAEQEVARIEAEKSLWDRMQEKAEAEGVSEEPAKPKPAKKKKATTKKASKLTKAQKRAALRKANKDQGRGWNWVDVTGHLRKTGSSAS